MVDAARRLAGDVRAQEEAELARLMADTGDNPHRPRRTQPNPTEPTMTQKH